MILARATQRSLPRRMLPATSVLATLLVGGCAGMSDPTGLIGGKSAGTAPPPQPVLAERATVAGPAAPTAVVEESFVLDGAILPVARGQSRVETRADMRRTDSAVTFDNWLMRQFAPDGRTSDIVRVDRKLVWSLVPAKREYTECPITGCASAASRPGQQQQQPRPDEPKKQQEPTCPVTLKTNDLKVDATGERRNVNSFSTERFRIDWIVALADNAGRTTTNRVQMDLWTTPETGAVKEVQAINENFQRRYASALTRGDSPVGKFLPQNVAAAMASLMRNVDANDQRTLARWAAELKKVRGYPIATQMSWTAEGTICGDQGAGGSAPATAAGIGGMLGGMFGGRKADGAPAPLITFSHEVRTVAVQPVADTVFTPPADYRKTN
jgi:hypothetical protein